MLSARISLGNCFLGRTKLTKTILEKGRGAKLLAKICSPVPLSYICLLLDLSRQILVLLNPLTHLCNYFSRHGVREGGVSRLRLQNEDRMRNSLADSLPLHQPCTHSLDAHASFIPFVPLCPHLAWLHCSSLTEVRYRVRFVF